MAIALSFIPLLHGCQLDLIESLKQNARMYTSPRLSGTRRLLVGSQVAIAVLLATVAA